MSKKKKSKKGCGCVLLFIVVFFMLPTAFSGVMALIDHLALEEERAYREQWAVFFDPFDAAADHLANGDYLAALDAADEAVAVAQAHPELDSLYRAHAYARKADAYIELWQFVDAEAALKEGLLYADAALQYELNHTLAEVQGRIVDNDTERYEQQIYHAAPGIGPARTLHGKVVIAYVFIDDGTLSIWSLKNQQFVLAQLRRVKQWFQAQARPYGITGLTFTERIFQYDKDPLLRNALTTLRTDDADLGYDLAQRVARLHGARSVNAFLYRLAREEDADQAILLLHANFNKRSFAHVCWTGCFAQAEYAYLLKSTERRRWDAIGYVQAHEALHLFGADDLYNLEGGRYYAPRDIMHHYARYIEASVIDSLTAFSVGWLDQLPTPTPFPIQQADADP